MRRPHLSAALALVALTCLSSVPLKAEEPSANQPTAISAPQNTPSPTAVRDPSRPPIMILGRIGTTIRTDRDRAGITHHSSTRQFVQTPMTRQMDGSLPYNRKFGDGTVMTGADRVGVTRVGKTIPFGAEVGTRRTGWLNSGLTTPHTPSRVWSSFRKAP